MIGFLSNSWASWYLFYLGLFQADTVTQREIPLDPDPSNSQ